MELRLVVKVEPPLVVEVEPQLVVQDTQPRDLVVAGRQQLVVQVQLLVKLLITPLQDPIVQFVTQGIAGVFWTNT